MNRFHRKNVKKHHSIFLRLLFVLLATMGLIHLVVGGVFGLMFRSGSKKAVESNIRNYAVYMARDIGSPPDTVLAGALSRTYDVYIQYDSDSLTWASHSVMPRKSRMWTPTGRWRQPVVLENGDGSRLTLIWRFGPFGNMHRQMILGMFVIVTVIFLGAHAYIRRILRPIRWLKKGVDEIGAGNLEVTIRGEREDELGRLTESFNSMVRRIRDMLKSRDQLLLDVSHELRSPLTRIKVALELTGESEKKSAILGDIAEIETMLSEILETERLDTEHGRLRKTDTDLVALIRDVMKEFQDRPPGFRMQVRPESVILSLDPERIRLVMKNVFENAFKFSRKESEPVSVSVTVQADRVMVRVRDDGIGIPEDQIPYLFEPFYRADRSRSKTIGGYGLGLHLCRKIVNAHGGEISIRNNETGNGVTVSVELPRFS
ncbi:HAMP domain-containing histidine kinase [bacterium]|nr:HAMP domain-containing histidine kinase [bacterium]